MKKFFLLFAVLGLFTFSANAQKKSCSMAKKATCSMSKTAKVDANNPAAVLAAQSDDIEARVCAQSGTVSYVKKSVCAHSGNVSFTNVEYSAEAKKFVNVSPSDMKAAPAAVKTSKAPSCSKSKKACTKPCSKTTAVKATKVSKVTTAKKACTKKSAACCAKDKKAVSTKLVKNEK